ncbi:MAG: DNA-binding response regulator [Bacteroidetes bacterium GWC2_33_15]|nr:MAG: DNA-binding response regulator [Bacteroidetes bacterium GWA2_33_15]OFX49517.1 MAG: DNA-binding response regulator [Bacteroidetes bacterium GWC2_33_15]OFX63644.1 MAG: DNA-binding response regulator [Bacteroidetes bacterium GWB2_32_14]OFX68858.1 MAG: DNA-binding response regulator [Bacteroidetes bacterium GWD2_33_33]HAN17544.1 DNA-binding response regulator [Bacteroidales bacterium]
MENKLKAVIVDDELASRETLASYLKNYCPDIYLVADADSVKSGLEIIKKNKPDVVFLDIEMPYGNAFDLLEQVDNIDFDLVFVTAYSNYAIKALNMSASYYILKPISIDELIHAVEKIKSERNSGDISIHSKILIENIQSVNKQNHKIVLPQLNGFDVIKVNDIIRCRANDNFTEFYLTNGTRKLISRTLKFYEDILKDFDFVRVHKSHLINLQYVTRYMKGKGGQVEMTDGSVVDVSVNQKAAFLEKFK